MVTGPYVPDGWSECVACGCRADRHDFLTDNAGCCSRCTGFDPGDMVPTNRGDRG